MLGSGAQDALHQLSFIPTVTSDDHRHFLRWRDVVARLEGEIAVVMPHGFDVSI
jgi:hypothetical protein